jgi:hypothetical protein
MQREIFVTGNEGLRIEGRAGGAGGVGTVGAAGQTWLITEGG